MKRFWEKVDKSGDCWIWTACTLSDGYGRFSLGGKVMLAHRVSLLLSGRDIPAGMEVDHLCRTPACVNPAHMECVTRTEHAKRSLSATKSACVHGHLFDAKNTYIRPSGQRDCRACGVKRTAAYLRRKFAEVAT